MLDRRVAINELPVGLRAAFILRDLDGLSARACIRGYTRLFWRANTERRLAHMRSHALCPSPTWNFGALSSCSTARANISGQWRAISWLTCASTPHHKGFFMENKDRKSTRLNSSHSQISYAVFCLK